MPVYGEVEKIDTGLVYTTAMDADQQITVEEKIASLIVDNSTANEEVAAELGHAILITVLAEFRPDLVMPEVENDFDDAT